MLFKGFEIFFFSIFDADVEYFSIDSISKCCWNSSFSVLDQKRLIIIREQFFSKKDSIINELLFIINSNLSQSDVKLIKLSSHVVDCQCLKIKLDWSPAKRRNSCIIYRGYLCNCIIKHIDIIETIWIWKNDFLFWCWCFSICFRGKFSNLNKRFSTISCKLK